MSKLAVGAGGPGTTCRAAPTDYGSIIVQVDTRDGSTEAIKDALKGKTLIIQGARCVLGLAAADGGGHRINRLRALAHQRFV